MKHLLLGFAAALAMATGANAATFLNEANTDASSAINLFNSVVGVVTPVPEPATWAMMLVGVGALGAALRAKSKAAGRASLA